MVSGRIPVRSRQADCSRKIARRCDVYPKWLIGRSKGKSQRLPTLVGLPRCRGSSRARRHARQTTQALSPGVRDPARVLDARATRRLERTHETWASCAANRWCSRGRQGGLGRAVTAVGQRLHQFGNRQFRSRWWASGPAHLTVLGRDPKRPPRRGWNRARAQQTPERTGTLPGIESNIVNVDAQGCRCIGPSS